MGAVVEDSASMDPSRSVYGQLDPLFLAMSRFRQRDFERTTEICSRLLAENPYDKAVWFLKCRSMTCDEYVDDTELEQEGIGEMLLDDNAIASMPRPGTSLNRPMTSKNYDIGSNPSVRPLSSSGRPLTGFARPGTQSRLGTANMSVDQAFKGSKPGTSRPATALGRQLRLGTASLETGRGTNFIDIDKVDVRKFAAKPALAKALMDYLIYHEHNPRKALELGAEATFKANYEDWWWKARLGKCYYQLGLYRDAEKQFQSCAKQRQTIFVFLELCKVYLKLDQPKTAMKLYEEASSKFPGDVNLLLGQARVFDILNETSQSEKLYQKVLAVDPSNVEAIACLASNFFYTDQPELAVRYFRRLVQMGVNNSEIWNNLGLSCFYSSQYDLAITCFERALEIATDETIGEIWYNIAHLSIGVGDLGMAYQQLKIAVSMDPNHAEAFTNLGVLELRKGDIDSAQASFLMAQKLATYLFEPLYNGALLAYKLGEFQSAHTLVEKALEAFPDHADSQELLQLLQKHFESE